MQHLTAVVLLPGLPLSVLLTVVTQGLEAYGLPSSIDIDAVQPSTVPRVGTAAAALAAAAAGGAAGADKSMIYSKKLETTVK